MATSHSCSHWWHAPIYVTLSFFLAAISITSPPPPPLPPSSTVSATATATLNRHNFSITATLLHLNPSLFLSSSSNSTTIFAIHDSAFSTLIPSVTLPSLKLLLLYHSLPRKLTLPQLLLLPRNSCFPSSLPSKNLSVTKFNHSVFVNNVWVSHPDLFQDEFVSIHGVLAPFSEPNCRSSGYEHNWVRIVRGLSSNGFISFAIGLNSVLSGIVSEYPNLGPITIFAPPEFNFVSSSGLYLDRVVRYHVVRERYPYEEIASMPEKTQLATLLKGEALEITRSGFNGSRAMGINGVFVVSPHVFSTDSVVVHGISTAFKFLNHPNT